MPYDICFEKGPFHRGNLLPHRWSLLAADVAVMSAHIAFAPGQVCCQEALCAATFVPEFTRHKDGLILPRQLLRQPNSPGQPLTAPPPLGIV